MAYTETQDESWFSRIGKSIKGILGGILLIIAGIGILYYNEGRMVATETGIKQAQSSFVQAENISKIDPQFEGKLVYAKDKATTEEILKDPDTDIQLNAIALNRNVEYYQWDENEHKHTEKKTGGGTRTTYTYTYAKKWARAPINSEAFHDSTYQNSNHIISSIEKNNWLSNNVTFGAYQLPEFLVKQIKSDIPVEITLTDEQKTKIAGTMADSNSLTKPDDLIKTQGNTIYLGKSPASPNIGDMKITYTQAVPAVVSVIAQVKGNTFEAMKTKKGHNFSRLEMGEVPPEVMFENAHKENIMLTWMLRLAGLLANIIGFIVLLAPLGVLADVLPFIGNMVEAGTTFIGAILGFILSVVVIAIAWLAARPIIGGILFAIAIGGIILIVSKMKAQKATT